MISKNFDRIEAYFLGKLSSEEQKAFEIELDNNENLQREFSIHQLEHDVIQELQAQKLRSEIAFWQPNKQKLIFRIVKQYWAIAASIALIFASLTMYNQFNDTAISNKFYRHDGAYRGKGGNNTPPTVLENSIATAQKYHYEGNYSKAIEVYQNLLLDSTLVVDIRQEQEWNLALCQLAISDRESFLKSIDHILQTEPPHRYVLKAKELKQIAAKQWFMRLF